MTSPQTFPSMSQAQLLSPLVGLPAFILGVHSRPNPYESDSDEFTDEAPEPSSPGRGTEEYPDYEPTEEEKQSLCRAFTLLDIDGDGVIDLPDLEQLLISWGRLPMDEELRDIMSYAKATGCEGATGMDFEGFQRYITKQLAGTTDEEELRNSFKILDSDPPTGMINLLELRHYLKSEGMKLTDDEIDFLYREEDYWMLEEKNMFQYEELINKILDKPTCNSAFLNC